MCGVCGIFRFNDHFQASEEVVVAMRETLAHRGPDDRGAWRSPDGRVALGHRRLSIVDLSPAGHQPMSNESGDVWIVYNGEVYNHEELRRELEASGHTYRSRTDTETVLHLYEEIGARCVERLDGMFAFAIWDGRRRELFMARDRIGVKPLYYRLTPEGLLFASEVRAILEHPAVSPELDEESFFHYLTFAFTPAPKTMYAGISKLAPAEHMTVRADGSVRRELYWTPFSADATATASSMSDTEAEEHVLGLLRSSVRKRMMSDVPCGVFLSGGVDSSTNVALMAEVSSEPVRTYSIAPEQYSAYDELDYARSVAEWCGHIRTSLCLTGPASHSTSSRSWRERPAQLWSRSVRVRTRSFTDTGDMPSTGISCFPSNGCFRKQRASSRRAQLSAHPSALAASRGTRMPCRTRRTTRSLIVAAGSASGDR
jgi:asparagine synthase (glutamine-hydrolysing)